MVSIMIFIIVDCFSQGSTEPRVPSGKIEVDSSDKLQSPSLITVTIYL
jgi:hypothetical protein